MYIATTMDFTKTNENNEINDTNDIHPNLQKGGKISFTDMDPAVSPNLRN